jgi:hypothetical protein
MLLGVYPKGALIMSNISNAVGLVRPASGDARFPVLGFLNPILIDDELWELSQNPDNPSLASLVSKAAEAVDVFTNEVEHADFAILVTSSKGPVALTVRVSWEEASKCVKIAPLNLPPWSSNRARTYYVQH